ncbi:MULTISPECIES: S1 RNA-binding domain-containing protein [Deinococcus]|uniref:RNA binding S1 n=1 Tax=Deinococcus geothermalis (strain DSM 11300 / CIP 105573 / AG-3a) TaxID=319795 RepID=Q1J0K8_DEIGD|nr:MULTISPECIES: S1 RNA-binding domain-containing protein [Deinococcus]ABF44976.1 RNA binding S1 [Deinococcus geothermalis DSM 11300]TDE87476.1 S1 RNA-binding domain-containing protein [Deinococcus sp. S9]
MVQLDPGAVVEGRVTRVTDFGAFVQFENGETGLVHISQIAHSFVRNIHDHVREGETVEVKVLGRDERGRLDLSIKELLDEPEEVPRPRAIGRQSPQFEAKLRSFMRDAKERTGGGGKKGPATTKRKK